MLRGVSVGFLAMMLFASSVTPAGADSGGHTVGSIYHGIYKTFLSGDDRHHAWTSHDHGWKYAAIYSCGFTDPYCTTFRGDAGSSSVTHVHLDRYFNGLGSGYSSLGSIYCDGERSASIYSDGHGMCSHSRTD